MHACHHDRLSPSTPTKSKRKAHRRSHPSSRPRTSPKADSSCDVTNNGVTTTISPCRSRYKANPASGEPGDFLSAQDYQCTDGKWWKDVANSSPHQSMWSARYVDTTLRQAGIAACVPLNDLQTTAASAATQPNPLPGGYFWTDETWVTSRDGLIGVACSGFLLEKISKITLEGSV